MKPQDNHTICCLLVLLFVSLPATLLSQTPEYRVIRIDEPAYSDVFWKEGLNDSSVVVGLGNRGAFFWKNGIVTLAPACNSCTNHVICTGLNNDGVAVGWAMGCDTNDHAYRWTLTSCLDIGSQVQNDEAHAYGINSKGKIVGGIHPPGGKEIAFIYDGSLNILPIEGAAYGINDSDCVVGETTVGDSRRGFLYRSGNLTLLPGLEYAISINNRNQILGWGPGNVLWENGNVTTLGQFAPTCINDSGTVVGCVYYNPNFSYALVWKDGVLRKLNDLIPPNSGVHLNYACRINNKGEILCYGYPNGAWDTYYYLLTPNARVISPWANETWIAGEVDTIRWGGIGGGKTLTLDLSTDASSSWTMITSGISSDSGKYAWKIPAGTLSTKCRVKILDYSTFDLLATSDIFKIKPYVLTRVDPATGDYVAYDMSKDAWSFWNEEQDIWPTSWWSANFDYASGTDPFPGKPYPTWRRDRVFKDALPSDYPDWESFVRAFTIDACYLDTALPIYFDKAVERWGLIKEEFGGACFGLSGTNAMAFSHRDQFLDKFPSFPLTLDGDPAIVNPNAAVIRTVAETFAHSCGNPTQFRWQYYTPRPTQTLRDIREMLRQDDTPIRTLSMWYHGPDGGAHNVLPYKLERESDTSPKWNVFVYDNNEPFDYAATVIIDTADMNGFGWWRFPNQSWNGFKDLQLEEPSIVYLGNAELPKRQGPPSPFAVSAGTLKLYTTKHASIQIKDDVGNTTGFNDNIVLDEIPGSVALIPVTGRASAPYGYALASGNYTITVDSFQTSESKVFFFTENTTLGYRRWGADILQTDNLRSDTTGAPTLSIGNHDPGTKSISLKNILSETTLEKVYGVRLRACTE